MTARGPAVPHVLRPDGVARRGLAADESAMNGEIARSPEGEFLVAEVADEVYLYRPDDGILEKVRGAFEPFGVSPLPGSGDGRRFARIASPRDGPQLFERETRERERFALPARARASVWMRCGFSEVLETDVYRNWPVVASAPQWRCVELRERRMRTERSRDDLPPGIAEASAKWAR